MRTLFFIVGLSYCVCLLTSCATPKSNFAPVSASDTSNSDISIGSYDKEMVNCITRRWEDLLKKHRYNYDRQGVVVIEFREHQNGNVSNFHTKQNDVGVLLGLLCEESIQQCAPFSPWSPDMVRMIGTDYRQITFTFNY